MSEAVALASAIEREMGNRQGQRTDLGGELVQNLAQVEPGEKTRDVAARKAGFGNRETYRQAKTVVEHGAPNVVAAMNKGELATRIQARAIRRAGELLKEFDGRGGDRSKSDGAGTSAPAQRQAAADAGMSKRQQVTAVRVARVPQQELARLFWRSGWTQEELAKKEGKSQRWVSYRLLFGRFLEFSTSCSISHNPAFSKLTEGRFRDYWSRTDKAESNERIRFGAPRGVSNLWLVSVCKPCAQVIFDGREIGNGGVPALRGSKGGALLRK